MTENSSQFAFDNINGALIMSHETGKRREIYLDQFVFRQSDDMPDGKLGGQVVYSLRAITKYSRVLAEKAARDAGISSEKAIKKMQKIFLEELYGVYIRPVWPGMLSARKKQNTMKKQVLAKQPGAMGEWRARLDGGSLVVLARYDHLEGTKYSPFIKMSGRQMARQKNLYEGANAEFLRLFGDSGELSLDGILESIVEGRDSPLKPDRGVYYFTFNLDYKQTRTKDE